MNVHHIDLPVLRGQDTIARLWPIIEGRGVIAGSYAAFAACPHGCPILPNDIDIFAYTVLTARGIANRLASYYPKREGTVYNFPATAERIAIQVIEPDPRWRIWPDDLLEFFDMDICRAVLIEPGVVRADEHCGWLAGKLLKIQSPLRSLKRVMKYHARGVDFNDHELLKLFDAWACLSLESRLAQIDAANREAQDTPVEFDYTFNPDDEYLGD